MKEESLPLILFYFWLFKTNRFKVSLKVYRFSLKVLLFKYISNLKINIANLNWIEIVQFDQINEILFYLPIVRKKILKKYSKQDFQILGFGNEMIWFLI